MGEKTWREGGIDEIVSLGLQIPEFDDFYGSDVVAARLAGRESLVQIGQLDGRDAGFKVGYALDDCTFYSWLGGVLPASRGTGLAQYLLEEQEAWVRVRGFEELQVKSTNQFPAMLRLLLRNGYLITACEDIGRGVLEHRIRFSKRLSPS